MHIEKKQTKTKHLHPISDGVFLMISNRQFIYLLNITRHVNSFMLFAWGHVNPYHAGTELFRFNIVNIMVADALATQGARTSAPMILTM